MTTARPDTSWKTATPLTDSCSNDDMMQLCPLGSDSGRRDQWYVFCTPLAVSSTRCSQPDLNLANLEATVAAKITLAFLLRRTSHQRKHFDDVNLRHHYFVLFSSDDTFFYNFFSYLKCQDKLCQKLRKFVELCHSYAQNTSGFISRTRCIRRFMRMSVCLFVCLFFCLSAKNSGTGRAIVVKFSGQLQGALGIVYGAKS